MSKFSGCRLLKKSFAPALAVCALLALGAPTLAVNLEDITTVDGNIININFTSANDTYVKSESMSFENYGYIVNGVVDGNNRSTIDLNSYNGFEPNSGILVSDMKIMNGGTFRGAAINLISNDVPSCITNTIFTDNYAKIEGGAIYNEASLITSITGKFLDNIARDSDYASGGAIYNSIARDRAGIIAQTGIIEIDATFVGNSAQSDTARGGAIYNADKIGSIKGYFESNSAERAPIVGSDVAPIDVSGFAYGGAIYNTNDIESIDADFKANYASSFDTAYGGAIYTSGNIGTIAGDFVENYVSAASDAYGGAIYVRDDVEKITGSFTENYATSYDYARGGAIYSYAGIHAASLDETETNNSLDIEADFTENFAMAYNEASGGAIYNEGEIASIKGNFNGNYAMERPMEGSISTFLLVTPTATGGAIHNEGLIDSIVSDFTNNYVSASRVAGGAIHNEYYIESIAGNFTGNLADGIEAYGGAIHNSGWIDSISGDFTNNHVKGFEFAVGGAVANSTRPSILTAYNTIGYYQNVIKDNDGNEVLNAYQYTGNLTDSKYIAVLKDGANIGTYKSDSFTNNLSSYYSMYDVDNVEDLKAAMEKDGYSFTSPQDIYNEYNQYDNQSNIVTMARTTQALTFRNSSFINNYAEVTEENGEVFGGAIDSIGNIRMIVDDGNTTLISGNYVKTTEGTNDNAIYMGDNSVLVFDSRNNSTLQVDDKIEFEQEVLAPISDDTPAPLALVQENENSYFLLVGDNTGKTVLNNDVIGADIIALDSTNVYLGRDNVLNQSGSISLGNGFLSMANGAVGVMHLPRVGFEGETNLAVDVDLATETMDRIIGDEYYLIETEHDAGYDYDRVESKLHVSHLNLLSDATKDEVKILFADEEFAPIVDYTGGNPVAYSPIYKYDVGYKVDEADKLGYFFFNRSAGAGNPSDNFNPSVLATPAAQQSGAQATVTESVRFAFQHADTFTQLPMSIRMSMMDNRYAIAEGNPTYQRPFHMQNKGVWVKPYTSFESMSLKNGPKVDAITYGTLIGFDSDFQKFKNDWYGVTSVYVGYNGSLIDYQNVDTTMNGGMLGLTETWYKDKFFTALTITAGASAGSTSTMYGHENFAMLLGGIGSKTGYNFEFKDGRYIIQPIMFMNYTFVNTFDYTSASGVAIDSDPLHSLQLNPSIRFIANCSNGWQPYASVGMVWNVLNSSKVRANDVLLPRMSIKPYVEYGLGIQRTWAERFTAYGQAMLRNGGRNGVMLSGGMRWSLGDGEAIDINDL